MSFSEQNIDTFVEILTQQRTLFSPEQLTELEQVVDPLEDDIEALSEAISLWLENYPELEEAQAQLFDSLSSEMAFGSKQGKAPKSKSKLNKKMLRNAIVQGSKSEESQYSRDKTPDNK